jgi:beta-galactosidase
VDFAPGTIKAVGRNAGKVVAEFELKTAGKPAKIILTPDKTALSNDWNDVVYMMATVVDANGVLVPSASDMIAFDVQGAGVLAAVDSADNSDHDPFQSSRRRVFQGTNFALIKANKSAGRIAVSATAPGLAGAKSVLTVGSRPSASVK